MNLGSQAGRPALIPEADIETQFLASAGDNSTFTSASATNGLLDTIEPRYYVSISSTRADGPSIDGLQQVPFYEQKFDVRSTSAAIAEKIDAAIEKIKLVDKSVLLESSSNIRRLLEYYAEIDKLLLDVPYGMLSSLIVIYRRCEL